MQMLKLKIIWHIWNLGHWLSQYFSDWIYVPPLSILIYSLLSYSVEGRAVKKAGIRELLQNVDNIKSQPKTQTHFQFVIFYATGSFFHDGPIMGRNNIRWQHRKDLLNKLKPHLLCAVENQNAESYLKSNSEY